MAISCSECEGHQDIACPDCGKDYYLRDTEAQAEIARLKADLAELKTQLGMCDHSLHKAWNDAIEAAAIKAETCALVLPVRGKRERVEMQRVNTARAIRSLRKET